MHAQFLALLALAAPLYAISITSPSKNDVVDPAAGVTVEWTTVSSDPDTAHLFLVNMAAGNTPFSKDLGEVDLSAGSETVTVSGVPDGEGYQFNFQSVTTQNTGILAQSEQFEVEASADDESSSSRSSSSASATASTSETASASSTESAFATTTETATTLSTVSSSATDSAATGAETATTTDAAETSTSTGGAAPTGMAVQAGSLFALVAGVAAVLA
ncbi:hypothetical protein N658DRAFT_509176 [Parathielavia hyrcaniae]|uniref:Yeast cell wall synthesis Kre9/Knh1-like N-terminal domain-containing protein n=1 Tax=Parathielavia hyrcaniae TaxID=113614 RepID=A0AAN6SZP0_9PEZI|nr:hypothetical protein N658DRAFT_509176 [Parathielavia hyrcaniae]